MFRGRVTIGAIAAGALACLCLSGCRDGLESRVAHVRKLHEAGRFEEAIDAARAVLADVPGQPAASYWLGLSLLRSGRPSPAVFPLRKAFEDEGVEMHAGVALAEALLASQSFDAVLEVTDDLVEIREDLDEVWRLRSLANLKLKDAEGALAATARLLRFDDRDVWSLQTRALALRMAGRHEEAADAWRKIGGVAEARDLAELAAIACVERAAAAAAWPSEAESLRLLEPVRRCAERFPDEASAVETLARLHFALEQPDEGFALLRSFAARDPDPARRLVLARQLGARGRADEALEVLRAAAAESAAPRVRAALADLYRQRGEVENALRSLRGLVDRADRYRFTYVELLIESGDLDAAAVAAEDLEDPAFRELIRGRLLLERSDYAGALSALEAGLVLWPDNAGARGLAARAAEEVGDGERALLEYRESIRADASGAGLAGARLALALGRHEAALEFTRRYLAAARERPFDALAIGVRAAHTLGRDELVQAYLRALETEHGADRAILERARAHLRDGAPAQAARTIEGSGLDLLEPGHEDVLRTLVEARILAGDGERAEAFLTRALSTERGRPELWAYRGRVRFAQGAFALARDDLARAVALDAACAVGLAGLGALELRAGDLEGAFNLYARAADAEPDYVDAALSAAQIARDLGRRDEAERRLRRVLRRNRGEVRAANDLAWMLADDGRRLDEALSLARLAVRLEPSPSTVDTLAHVLSRRGDDADALAVLEEGARRHPRSVLLRERLERTREIAGRAADVGGGSGGRPGS